MGAGITEAVLVNPFEAVKVVQQSNKAKMNEVPSAWQVTREIIKRDVSLKMTKYKQINTMFNILIKSYTFRVLVRGD